MMNSIDRAKDVCNICGLNKNVTAENLNATPGLSVNCKRCGKYTITDIAIDDEICRKNKTKSYLLSGAIRYYHEHGLAPFSVDSLTFNADKFNDMVMPLVPKTVPEKMDRLLEYIARKTEHPGSLVTLYNDYDYPVAFCKDYGEMEYYMVHLQKSGYVEGAPTQGSWNLRLTPPGWKHLEELKKANKESKQAFVAMSFKPELIKVFKDGIEPIEKETGFTMKRVDSEEHNDKIDNRIISEIRKSRFLIADFTDQRQGVYFEAGYALGLGIPVIWTCRKNNIKQCHFDTRQYNHIVWKTADELKEKLKNRILATIGTAKSSNP